MKKNNLAIYISIGSIIIAAISCFHSCNAVGVAEKSNLLSAESNKIAYEAFKSSMNSFATENKPYLLMKPVKFKENDSFFRIWEKDGIVNLECQFEIRNGGKTSARDVSLPNVIAIEGEFKEDAQFEAILPKKLTIGPGQDYNLAISIGQKTKNNKHRERIIENYNKEDIEIKLQLVIFYFSELNANQKYSIKAVYKISKNRARIISYDEKEEIINSDKSEEKQSKSVL